MAEIKFKDQIDVLKIFSLFISYIKQGFKDTLEHHKYWELVYVNEGKISVSAENEIVDLYEGDLIIHPPYQNHKIENFEPGKTKITICSFLEGSNLLYKLKNYKFSLDSRQKNVVKGILYEFYISSRHDFDNRVSYTPSRSNSREDKLRGQCIKNYLEILLLSFIRNYYDEKEEKVLNTKDENSKTTCKNIVSLMKNNLHKDITLEEICHRSYLGKTSVTNMFKEHMGMSVMKYFVYLKIEKSKEFLLSTSLSVSEIAKVLNFSSQQYFSRTFKSFTKMSPIKYRQMHKK